ncbi:unnamed protein product, partial [Phaeothamnion confervicola]
MLLKLLAARVIDTEFYVTLDADVVCVRRGAATADLVSRGEGQAAFVDEPRAVHPHWWAGGASTYNLAKIDDGGGFGVTPAVLSTGGVLLTLARLQEVWGAEDFASSLLSAWATAPDLMWSEYTLYRLTLRHLRMFYRLHA